MSVAGGPVTPSNDKLLKLPEVAERLSVDLSTVYRLKNRGELPSPVRVGGRSVRYRASDIDNFIRGLDSGDGQRDR